MWTRLRPHRGPYNGVGQHQLPNLTDAALVIRGFVFYPTAEGQIAIDLAWPHADSCINQLVVIEDCHFVPRDGFHWQHCIRLTNGWNAYIHNCMMTGPTGIAEAPLTEGGVILDGQSTGVTIRTLIASAMLCPVLIKGECEGTTIDDLKAVGCKHGIIAHPDSGGGEPDLKISRCHINSTNYGIQLRHRYQVDIERVTFYAGDYYDETRGQPFYGIVAEDCKGVDLDRVKWTTNGPPGPLAKPEALIVPFTSSNSLVFGEVQRVSDKERAA